jgi:hypothetical protein
MTGHLVEFRVQGFNVRRATLKIARRGVCAAGGSRYAATE